jgi:hypothetical protein
MQHKHAKEIKAWADGAQIQCSWKNEEYWCDIADPSWSLDCNYRIKADSDADAYRELLRNYIDIKLKYEALVLAVKSLGEHYA